MIGSNLSLLETCRRVSCPQLILSKYMMFKNSTDMAALSHIVLPVREMAECNFSNTFFSACSVLLLAMAVLTGVGQDCQL